MKKILNNSTKNKITSKVNNETPIKVQWKSMNFIQRENIKLHWNRVTNPQWNTKEKDSNIKYNAQKKKEINKRKINKPLSFPLVFKFACNWSSLIFSMYLEIWFINCSVYIFDIYLLFLSKYIYLEPAMEVIIEFLFIQNNNTNNLLNNISFFVENTRRTRIKTTCNDKLKKV